jgi:hypothetical protein
MKVYYQIKRKLKLLRLKFRRLQAARRWGKDALAQAPPVLGFAIPKAGSHLIIQILYGLTKIGPFVKPGFPPVNRFEDNTKQNEATILEEIYGMRSGEIRYGYLHPKEPYLSAITASGRASIFVYRDPRDQLVSLVFYAKDMQLDHHMHENFDQVLSTMEERLNVVIEGSDLPDLLMVNVRERYEDYLGWFERDDVLCLKFEDLILDQENTLGKFLDYIDSFGVSLSVSRQEAIEVLSDAVKPKNSGTFRKGQPGDWKNHFTEDNKRRFKAVAGDLLSRLGYEDNDQDW